MKPLHAKWFVDQYNILKDDKEIAMFSEVQGLLMLLRMTNIWQKNLRTLSRKFDCKTCFLLQTYEATS